MNYYEPLQRQDTKRWDYTQSRDGRTWPIGYCRGWREESEDELVARLGDHMGRRAYEAQERRRAERERYHEDGHETRAEACDCYKQFVLDHYVNYEFGTSENTQHKCEFEGCEEWTQRAVMINHFTHHLCDAHANRESLEKLYSVDTSFGSY